MDAVQYRTVAGTFTARVPDGSDHDYNPDRVTMEGRVVFEPVLAHPDRPIPYSVVPEMILPRPIRAEIVDGELMVFVARDDETVAQPVRLMVSMDDRGAYPWHWRMRYLELTLAGEELAPPAMEFHLPPGPGVFRLEEAAPMTTRTSSPVLRGPQGPQGDLADHYSLGDRAGALDLGEFSLSTVVRLTAVGDLTVEDLPQTLGKAGTCTLFIAQGGTGGHTLTVRGARTPYGTPVPLSSTPGAIDMVHLLHSGQDWFVTVGAPDARVPAGWQP
ncbi:hypothetical protein [Sediminivirga luteola]|uniref:Uncharacterized protein n=1 Tax=Sediminivirga luteola TaxID=1774748 RepID=A0A8J2XKK1_9MICO|nr:hypothetical protein [Sediminivirga luteola]GGA10555.1 hypothetical protein GCM10011333_11700 [Sediminivirga luteola]